MAANNTAAAEAAAHGQIEAGRIQADADVQSAEIYRLTETEVADKTLQGTLDSNLKNYEAVLAQTKVDLQMNINDNETKMEQLRIEAIRINQVEAVNAAANLRSATAEVREADAERIKYERKYGDRNRSGGYHYFGFDNDLSSTSNVSNSIS